MTYSYNLNTGSLFNYVNHIEVGGNVVFVVCSLLLLVFTQCYRVVCNYYLACLLGLLETASSGALVVHPKAADCSTVYTSSTLPQAIIDRDPATAGTQEIKNYAAFLGYIASFGNNGVNGVYQTSQSRIVSQ